MYNWNILARTLDFSLTVTDGSVVAQYKGRSFTSVNDLIEAVAQDTGYQLYNNPITVRAWITNENGFECCGEFDAEEWLKVATLEDLFDCLTLLEDGTVSWQANDVVETVEGAAIDNFFNTRPEHDEWQCNLDDNDVMRWLFVNRPEYFAKLTAHRVAHKLEGGVC